MEWWNVRGRTQQTPENIRYDAMRFMASVTQLGLAVAVKDFGLFEHIVTEKKQTRHNKTTYKIEYLLMVFWMIWSLWDGSLNTIIANFEKRRKVSIGKSTLSEVIGILQLKPTVSK